MCNGWYNSFMNCFQSIGVNSTAFEIRSSDGGASFEQRGRADWTSRFYTVGCVRRFKALHPKCPVLYIKIRKNWTKRDKPSVRRYLGVQFYKKLDTFWTPLRDLSVSLCFLGVESCSRKIPRREHRGFAEAERTAGMPLNTNASDSHTPKYFVFY